MRQFSKSIKSTAFIYAATYVALMVLLFLTYGEYRWQAIPHPMGVAYAIALVKASLVFWFFMELKESSTLIRWTCLAGLIWIAILFGLTALIF